MKVESGSWVQVEGKLVPKSEYTRPSNTAPYIHGDIESFKSPIDGRVITDRAQLRKHMNEHGVTDARDYSNDWYEQKGRARDAILRSESEQCKRDRIQAINEAINKHS